jgi:hypothetical protein
MEFGLGDQIVASAIRFNRRRKDRILPVKTLSPRTFTLTAIQSMEENGDQSIVCRACQRELSSRSMAKTAPKISTSLVRPSFR